MFDRICTALSLGELTAPPLRLSGGYTHQMFRLVTASGDYAVKLLNPEIMSRPDALENYRTAEGFEALLKNENLPILPAKVIHGRKLQRVDGQYLYVFDYFDGRVLQAEDITPAHCAKIGAVLARIHGLARQREAASAESSAPIAWDALAEALLASADAQAEGCALRAAIPLLKCVTAAMEEANARLPRVEALCHNDMDPKNVLWQGEDFRIIDLECLGYADPRQELLDLAVSWSGGREAQFKAFVSAYAAQGGVFPADAAAVYDSRRNILDWLAYNARRTLADDPEERRIAREQIRWSLEKIRQDTEMREAILRWMTEISP